VIVPGEVEVRLDSIRRAWERGGNYEFWLGLSTPSDDVDAFGRALARANRAEGPDGIYAQLETPVPGGLVTLVGTGMDDAVANLERWATELGRHLERVGLSGILQGVRPRHWPKWVSAPTIEPDSRIWPAVFARWSVDLDAMIAAYRTHRGGWHVPEDATARICDHLAGWSEPGGPEVIVGRDAITYPARDGSTVAGDLRRAASGNHGASVLRFVDDAQTARVARLGAAGETALQVIGRAADDWSHRIGELRRGMTALPDILDLAFVRPTRRGMGTWEALDIHQPLDGIRHEDVTERGRHLLTRYVPDAHGMQVLRDDHLDNAGDLDGWKVTNLGHGRHLVEAADLAPWYADPLPDPDVVERARRDFAGMLLTPDVLAANPPPWLAR
jgi:hypothetical protein